VVLTAVLPPPSTVMLTVFYGLHKLNYYPLKPGGGLRAGGGAAPAEPARPGSQAGIPHDGGQAAPSPRAPRGVAAEHGQRPPRSRRYPQARASVEAGWGLGAVRAWPPPPVSSRLSRMVENEVCPFEVLAPDLELLDLLLDGRELLLDLDRLGDRLGP